MPGKTTNATRHFTSSGIGQRTVHLLPYYLDRALPDRAVKPVEAGTRRKCRKNFPPPTGTCAGFGCKSR